MLHRVHRESAQPRPPGESVSEPADSRSHASFVRTGRPLGREPAGRARGDRRRAPGWSWAELADAIGRLAAALAGPGCGRGDRIAIQAPTSAEFVAVYLAALQAGLVVVPVNPAYTLPELDHILADSGARMLVTARSRSVGAADELLERHPRPGARSWSRPAPAATSWRPCRAARAAPATSGLEQGGRSGERPGRAALHLGHVRPSEGRDAAGAGAAGQPGPARRAAAAAGDRRPTGSSCRCRCSTSSG